MVKQQFPEEEIQKLNNEMRRWANSVIVQVEIKKKKKWMIT